MSKDISNCEVFSASRRKRPKLTRDSESDSDEDLTDCDSETAKKEVEELEEALLRKEAEIKDLNYELEKERQKHEEYVVSTMEKDKTNKQTISKQQEEIKKLTKDNDDLKNLVEYLKEENKNLNEILSATALGSARSLDKPKNQTVPDESNIMIVPDEFTPVDVAIKKEPPDPVEIQDYLELGTENHKEECLLPVVNETPLSSVTDSEPKVETEKSAGPSKISKLVDKVQNKSGRSSLSVPSASNAKPQDQTEEESTSDGNGSNATNKTELFICLVCAFSTNDKDDFDAHTRLHTGVCDKCDFASSDFQELSDHRLKYHPDAKPFLKKQKVNKKLKRVHVVRYPSDPTSQRSVPSDVQTLKCDSCEYTTRWPSALMRHKQLHSVERNYKCHVCDFAAKTKNNLSKHLVKHKEDRPFKCHMCESSFKHRHALVYHLQNHMGLKPYKCQECDYASMKKSNLIFHIRTHTGERPYKCEECESSFKVSSDLTRHVRRMHKVKVGKNVQTSLENNL